MNNINKKKIEIKDLVLNIVMTLITLGVILYAYFFTLPFVVQAIIWFVWFVVILSLGYQTAKGKLIYEFILEAKIELMKVVWPTRQETIQTTTIVMIMVTLTGFVLWGVDSIMLWAIAKITHLG